jgi:hypothetical protein
MECALSNVQILNESGAMLVNPDEENLNVHNRQPSFDGHPRVG